MRTNFALTPEQRADARRALVLIGEKNLTLEACVRVALQLPGAAAGDFEAKPLPSAIGLFLDATMNRGCRPKTVQFYEHLLDVFAAEHPGLTTAGLTPQICKSWIETPGRSRGGQLARWRGLRAFLRWGTQSEPPCVPRDLVERISIDGKQELAEPAYLTVEDAAAVLSNAPDNVRNGIALCLFAGIRPAEVCRLTWDSIDIKGRIIRIPAATSKIGRGRIIEGIPVTLWHWLTVGRGNVCPVRPDELTRYAKTAGGFYKNRKKRWPFDGLRHTFATYHVAAINNPGLTALILGHGGDTTMLHRHYRGLATKAQGEAYFALAPVGKKTAPAAKQGPSGS